MRPGAPTHGFGSFCSATQVEGTSSTIGTERLVNPVLALDEDSYVAQTLAGLDAYPAYYAHMGPANAAGPEGPDLSPPRRADAAELRSRIEAGEWVVDLRARRAFAAGHLAGTLSFDLDGSFATYLGWLIPWNTPLTLLGQTREQVAEAQRELVRIGIDRPQAAAHGEPAAWAQGQPLRSCVFVIDPGGILRAMIYYPLTTGRNMDEILRLIDALQAADTHKVATPANWRPGEPVIVPAPVTAEQAAERVADGYECTDWYLCTKKV